MVGPAVFVILICTDFPSYPPGAIGLTDSEFSERRKPEVIDSLLCDGTESSVLNCKIIFEGSESCGQFEDAGIVCQGKLKICYSKI